MNPQIFGVVMDRLYAAGALEVFYVAGADEEEPAGHAADGGRAARSGARQMTDIIFRETTTIGLRHYDVDRECLRARDRHGRDAARRRALQGRPARRPRR